MIRNYIKIAFRNIQKNKVYASINILGLAVGLAVTMLIGLWIADEFNFNNYFKEKERIARVFQHQTINGVTGSSSAIPLPLAPSLRQQYGDNFKYICLSSWEFSAHINYSEKTISRKGFYIEKDAPKLLDLKILKGDVEGLKNIKTIMISASLASDLFGADNPIGKIVKIDNQHSMNVVAIYEDIPENTSFYKVDYLMPWKHYVSKSEWVQGVLDNWGDNSHQMFVKIAANVSIADINAKIKSIKKEASAETAVFDPVIFIYPMKKWRLYSNFENGVESGGRILYIWIFGIVAVFVLLLACINFINLSTARSEKRATEVGIRKSIGSNRFQLFIQFLTESVLMVCIAFVFAIILVLLFLNGFNHLIDKHIVFPWGNLSFWGVSLLFILFTALLSGSYPAIYLSSFNPVTVLKGTFNTGRYSTLPRKILVVMQFTFSIALIIGTLVVIKQIEHSKNRPIGYNVSGLIQIPAGSREFNGKSDVFRTQLLSSGAIEEMCSSSSPITAVYSNRSGYQWEGKPVGFQEDLAYTDVSYEFMNTLGAKFISGRNFSREFATDSAAVILNETAVSYMGLKNPVGKYITGMGNSDFKLKIIGVVKDMLVQSPYKPVKQAMYAFDKFENFSFYNLRLHPERSVSASLIEIEKVFKANFPNIPFEYEFIDKNFEKKFSIEQRIADACKIFTILAILISCLGILGLATFVVEKRTKEIGIRKVLGATVKQLWLLISKDFLVLISISLLIAFPLAFYMMKEWLQKYSYRTEITWDLFAFSGIGAFVIVIISTSFQAVKAALKNPVESIKTE